MKTVERSFIFKKEMVEYIADYYSGIAEALSEEEYNELKNMYKPTPDLDCCGWEITVGSFKDFTIYRRFNGDWVAERNA